MERPLYWYIGNLHILTTMYTESALCKLLCKLKDRVAAEVFDID